MNSIISLLLAQPSPGGCMRQKQTLNFHVTRGGQPRCLKNRKSANPASLLSEACFEKQASTLLWKGCSTKPPADLDMCVPRCVCPPTLCREWLLTGQKTCIKGNFFVIFLDFLGSVAWICQLGAWNCQLGAWICLLSAWTCLLSA